MGSMQAQTKTDIQTEIAAIQTAIQNLAMHWTAFRNLQIAARTAGPRPQAFDNSLALSDVAGNVGSYMRSQGLGLVLDYAPPLAGSSGVAITDLVATINKRLLGM